MNPLKRLIIYTVMFVVYLYTAVPASEDYFGIRNLYISAPLIFCVPNMVFAFFFLKLKFILNITAAVVVAFVAIYISFKIGDTRLFEYYDAYNIKTIIFSNALVSILLWEILYQYKNSIIARFN